jgi:hypothetical protein
LASSVLRDPVAEVPRTVGEVAEVHPAHDAALLVADQEQHRRTRFVLGDQPGVPLRKRREVVLATVAHRAGEEHPVLPLERQGLVLVLRGQQVDARVLVHGVTMTHPGSR